MPSALSPRSDKLLVPFATNLHSFPDAGAALPAEYPHLCLVSLCGSRNGPNRETLSWAILALPFGADVWLYWYR